MPSESLTFPILPPPQLRSWNIPAPVIYPPGSDPALFSIINPNSHCSRVLATVDSMDVDPCVIGLRDEQIVAKEVDLTVSEQAGVVLSKATTMVPPTSDHPTSSSVVAPPQTVKDVVTTTESRNTDFIVCDVCNVKIHVKDTQKSIMNHETTSPVANGVLDQESEKKNKNENFDIAQKVIVSTPSSAANDILDQQSQEKNKNQDLDITQKVVVSTPSFIAYGILDQESEKQNKKKDLDTTQKLIVSTTSSIANDTLDQKLEKKNQDLWQNEAEFESLFVCGIPEHGIDYPKIAIVEVDESVLKIGAPNAKSVSGIKVKASKSTVPPMSRDNIAGKPLTTLVTSMDTTSVTKPVEKLKSIESGSGSLDNGKTTLCEICKIRCHFKLFDEHLSGKKHKKNLEKLEKLRNFPLPIIDSVTAAPAEQLKSTKGEVVNPNNGNSARCELCGVCCRSPASLNNHILGKMHQKNLKRSGKQHVLLPEPMNEVGEVVVSERSKRKVGDSLKCDKDSDAKRQKMDEEERWGVLVKCKVCNVDRNGFMAFKTHHESSEHLKMAQNQANGGSNGLQV